MFQRKNITIFINGNNNNSNIFQQLKLFPGQWKNEIEKRIIKEIKKIILLDLK